MIRAGSLTLDDLERLMWAYGGTIETRPLGRYALVGARMDGRLVTLYADGAA